MRDSGFVLLSVLILVICLSLTGFYMLDHFLLQAKINQNLYFEMKTYYLAKAGIEYAIYLLENSSFIQYKKILLDLKESGYIIIYLFESYENVKIVSTGYYQDYHYTGETIFTKPLR